MEAKKGRGSDALLDAHKSGGFTVDRDLVEALAATVGNRELNDILVKGQPAPDFLRATFVGGTAGDTGAFITEILGIIGMARGAGTIRVFPRGIPWPEEFLVDVVINEQRF